MLIFPVSNVYSFNNNLAIVDFPVPLAPTIAILAPLFICNEIQAYQDRIQRIYFENIHHIRYKTEH